MALKFKEHSLYVCIHAVNLIGLVVGVTIGAVVLSCCPICIILGIVGYVFYVFRHQKRIDRDLRSKNIPITTGNVMSGSHSAASGAAIASTY